MLLLDTLYSCTLYAAHASHAALASRTYIYPPLGIFYFVSHKSLYPPVFSHILPCAVLAISVTLVMFLLTYVPQAAILTLVNGPLGPVNALVLVLSESATITTLLARAFLLDDALLYLFDATLITKGHYTLVSKGRELKSGNDHKGVKKVGKLLIKPLNKLSPSRLIDYFIFLPLNLIPVVGTVIFLLAQGEKAGPEYHSRYFQLKGYEGQQKEEVVKRRRGGYIGFGVTAMALNLIPFASLFFVFTSTVGAALWAAAIEKESVEHPGKVAN